MKRATRLSHKTVHDIKPVSPDYDKQEMLENQAEISVSCDI